MKAVVMAGGFGTRIQPLTHSRPKPMLPIINRPMMEQTMLNLRDLGISEFIVLLYFKPEVIQNYFGDKSLLIHSGDAIVEYLEQNFIFKNLYEKTEMKFFASENPEALRKIASQWLRLD